MTLIQLLRKLSCYEIADVEFRRKWKTGNTAPYRDIWPFIQSSIIYYQFSLL